MAGVANDMLALADNEWVGVAYHSLVFPGVIKAVEKVLHARDPGPLLV